MPEPQRAVRIYMPTAQSFSRTVIPQEDVVIAYCRVSTLKTEQEDSLERQTEYYTKFIQQRQDWKFGGIYSDPGLSGTRAEKRPGFMSMIAACREKRINKIFCKSLSRFARNTVDALKYVRELKDLGISIYFESEKIDTLTPGGDMMLTVLAGLAEQESRNISQNVKWALEKKRESGEIIMSTKYFLGYTKDENKNIRVDLKEAQIVQRIFREFIGGYTAKQIAKKLMNDGIPSPYGLPSWQPTTIRSIIRNPKYIGDVIVGKTYKPDVLSPKRLKSDGIVSEMFKIPDAIPAIISRELFSLAEAEDNMRSGLRSSTKTGNGRYSHKHTFSGMLTCGSCGGKMRRWAQGYVEGQTKEYVWVCINKQVVKECDEKPIKEEAIKAAFVKVINDLINSGGQFIKELRDNIQAEINDDLSAEIDAIDNKIADLQSKAITLNRENRQGIIGNTEYENLMSRNETEQMALYQEKTEKVLKNEGVKLTKFRISEIERILTETVISDLFDADLFKELVESVTVTRERFIFNFKCGIQIKYAPEQAYRKYASRQ